MIRRHRYLEAAFALPTILIASVVMIIVMLASIQSVISVRIALDNQYYDKLAQEAGESGAAMAASCIKAGTTSWASPLRPGTNCNGSGTSTYLLNIQNVRTSFSVTSPTVSFDGGFSVSVNSSTELLRKSNSLPWKTYTQSATRVIQTFGWKSVAVGYTHACGILNDNKVYCWGDNASGQLGTGVTSTTPTPSPVAVRANSGDVLYGKDISKISAGGTITDSTTCAIATGSLYCWGDNADYQLANGGVVDSNVPVLVNTGGLAGKTVTDVDVGWSNICAIADGLVYCWGANASYQVGNGTSTAVITTPTAIWSSAVTSSTGASSTFGTHTGFYTGSSAGLAAIPTSISTGSSTNCATTRTVVAPIVDYLYCWGLNNAAEGRLGIGDATIARESVPRRVTTNISGKTISSLAEGAAHGCVLANDRAYCWGHGTNGQIGSAGTPIHRPAPTGVSQSAAPSGIGAGTIDAVSSGYNTSCAIADARTSIYCWGTGTNGQIGNSLSVQQNLPNQVTEEAGVIAGESFKSISTGDRSSCVLTLSGKVYCWGDDTYGVLGDGSTGPATVNKPVKTNVSNLPTSFVIY